MHPHLPALVQTPKSVVMFLHGYGADGNDLLDIARMWQPSLPDTCFISPHAPQACSIMPSGRQWFALNERSSAEFARGVEEARPQLESLIIQALSQTNVSLEKLALVGFSQGTMMALHVGLRLEQKIAGIIGYSGLLAAPEKLSTEIKNTPDVLLCHGTYDDVIPFQAMDLAQQALSTNGVNVTTHASHGVGHGIDQSGLMAGLSFLKQHLQA